MNSRSLGKIRQTLPREVLERLFVAEGRSAAAIAADTGLAKDAVLGLVERTTRPGVAARIDPDELYRLRCVKQVGMQELGRRLGIAPATAWGWMRQYGVPRRVHASAGRRCSGTWALVQSDGAGDVAARPRAPGEG